MATLLTLAAAVTRQILAGDLRVAVVPLRRDAPIYLAKSAPPHFGNARSVAALRRVEIIPRYTLPLTAR